MKRKLAITLLLLFISTPALAQSQAGFCKIWFTHKGATNTVKPAAYEAGVDVKGKPVLPADINNTATMFPADKVSFPLTVDLAQSLTALKPASIQMEANMAMVDIHRNGKVSVNGEDISDQAIELCTGEKPVHTPVTIKPVAPPQEPEIPVIKAPETASKRVIKRDDPALMAPTETKTTKDDIIWGQDY